MKLLILARHGDYDAQKQLSKAGRDQICQLVRALRGVLEGRVPRILSSPVSHAKQSADLLARELEAGRPILSASLGGDMPKLSDVYETVNQHLNGTEALLVVTHYEVTSAFPEYYASRAMREKVTSFGVEKGDAWILDLENLSLSLAR